MNLDVPYYRLGNHERVEYIPLKLALNDDAPPDNSHEYADSMEHKWAARCKPAQTKCQPV
uniref:Uncharacterized protein n=1 Tax=Spilarctia obliqua nucleopolyhedrovirus TaxID=1638618 RepID=A0A7G9U8E4_9ABAC|nr:hypothetical protein [Spilarctia obliqua nucleopolyhedrovirus]